MTSSVSFQGPSSSSSSTRPWKYHVFLNFIGDDTSGNFVSHLNQALNGRNLKTFINDQLKSGEEISRAIEESVTSIVVFSETYASSTLCLDELLTILKCRETKEQMIVPVFYNVKPSDVQYQQNSFEEAFAKHEKSLKDVIKVPKWRTALKEVGDLSGYHFTLPGNEAEFIAGIAQSSILSECRRRYLADYPVERGLRVQLANLFGSPLGNSEQGSNSSISSYIPFLFLIGSMIGLLQLHDVFETHPANMWITEAALVIFCLSHAAKKKINETHRARYSQIIDNFRVLSGALVLVSLSSISLPHSLWWLFFVIWVLMAFIVVACT